LQKLHTLGKEKVIHAKKEKGEEIKVRHDKSKKFLCKPHALIVCNVLIIVSTFSNLCGSLYLY
jgi:hypothetical protein